MAWKLGRKKKELPDGLFVKCDGCQGTVFKKEVENQLGVCPECGYHFRISARKHLDLVLDDNSFEEFDADLVTSDPLGFSDWMPYTERLEKARKQTGLKDAIITGRGRVEGKDVVVGAMDHLFIMATMGAVVGEKVVRSAERALEWQLPLILFCAGGGARMHEGMVSLTQMARTAAAVARLRESGPIYISVLTNPTTAGILASFAFLGDLILAEPKALIGFTGARVIRATLHTELPPGFQTAEFLLEHGFIDCIVPRSELKLRLERFLDYGSGAVEGK